MIAFCGHLSQDNDYFNYEQRHIKIIRETASECTLFLEKNEEFPISSPCNVLLVGSGQEILKKVD